jgi:hypothetical protein
MATIPGSHFTVTAALPVNVVPTTTGTGLPLPNGADFNLEVFGGAGSAPTTPAPGYLGLAVLTSGGTELDLVSGAYAVTDNGTGGDTINVLGNFDTVNGAPNDTISASGFEDVLNGAASGANLLSVSGNFDTVSTGGNASDTVGVSGLFDQINLAGSDTVNFTGGSFDTVTAGALAGTNQSTINLSGSTTNFTLNDGANVYADTVVGFNQGAGDTIKLNGTNTVAFALAHSTVIGADTKITLNDGSTILLKGITSLNSSFFS